MFACPFFSPDRGNSAFILIVMTSPDVIASYASLILADADIEITSDKLVTLAKAANAPLNSVWADIFAQAVEGKDLKDMLYSFGAAGPAPGAAATGSAAAPAAAAPAEEAAKEESESDEDMGLGLFD